MAEPRSCTSRSHATLRTAFLARSSTTPDCQRRCGGVDVPRSRAVRYVRPTHTRESSENRLFNHMMPHIWNTGRFGLDVSNAASSEALGRASATTHDNRSMSASEDRLPAWVELDRCDRASIPSRSEGGTRKPPSNPTLCTEPEALGTKRGLLSPQNLERCLRSIH